MLNFHSQIYRFLSRYQFTSTFSQMSADEGEIE
jgi:hypothetical protein